MNTTRRNAFKGSEPSCVKMGRHDPKTRRVWDQLNARFGTCPKCGTQPFEGYDSVKSYAKPPLAVASLVIALTNKGLLSLVGSIEGVVQLGEYSVEIIDTNTTGVARLSEALIAGSSALSNVEIRQEMFRCMDCGAVWNPGQLETSLPELGLTVYKY